MRGCDREDDRQLGGDPLERGDRDRKQRTVDQRRAVQRDQQVGAGLEPELCRGPALAKPRLERDQGVDHRVADEPAAIGRDALGGAGSPPPRRSAGRAARARWSTTTRLISSGIVRSKLRSPDSTWPTAIPSFAAQRRRGEGRVDVAGDEDQVRALGAQHRLEPLEHPRGLLAVATGADPEHVVGLGHAELVEEDIRHRPVVVLAGVDDDRGRRAEALASGGDHRRHLDEVRPASRRRGRSASRPLAGGGGPARAHLRRTRRSGRRARSRWRSAPRRSGW